MKKIMFSMIFSALALAACGDDGASPKHGEDGLPGADGAPGEDGLPGASSLVAIALEPAGENCEYGGRRVESGLDADGDGELGTEEVTAVAYVCDGAPGQDGQPGDDGQPGEDGQPGARSLIRLVRVHAEGPCEGGGVRVEVGLDADGDGALGEEEVDGAQTQYLCELVPGWSKLPSLPGVEQAHAFSLATDTADGSARLGFMFRDPDYQAELEALLWGGGIYSGAHTYVTYALSETPAWQPYEGRRTPQEYHHSELLVLNGDSFYTTQYAAFGGLLSVIKNGQAGTYAPTAAFVGERAHSLSFIEGDDEHIYFLIAQNDASVFGAGNQGLVFARLPTANTSFVTWPISWQLITILEPLATAQNDVSAIAMTNAGDAVIASYIVSGRASFRGTRDLAGIGETVTEGANFELPELASCEDAVSADAAWDGAHLYIACVSAAGAIEIRRGAIDDLDQEIAWETVPTTIGGNVEAIDLEASPERGVSVAVRQGERLRVYTWLTGAPSFDEAIPGHFDHVHAAEGLVLSVCDYDGENIVRTFSR